MFIAISTHPVRTKYKAKSYQSAALRTTSFIYSLYGSSIYIRTMHTGEGKQKSGMACIPDFLSNQYISVYPSYHSGTEKRVWNVNFTSIELLKPSSLITSPSGVPKAHPLSLLPHSNSKVPDDTSGFIGIEHFGCIKCHFLAIQIEVVKCGM